MDFDGDGIGDVLTGCWPGELYFFKGKAKGEFAAPVKLQRGGSDINLGSASTVFAADWRGIGRLDLLVGNIDGDILLVPNEGSTAHPTYGTPRKLEAGGKPIKAPHGDSQPVVADWDGDGLLDLIVGCGDGSVVWYRNVGSRTEPKLAKGINLVKPSTTNYALNPSPSNVRPGMRAKVCVADWSGNGQLDLLVGDFDTVAGEQPKLSEEDKKAQKEADLKMQKVQEKLQPIYNEYFKKLQEGAKPGDSAEVKKSREQKAQEIFSKKEIQELQKEQQRIFETVRKFQRPYTYRGNVWLYQRKTPAVGLR